MRDRQLSSSFFGVVIPAWVWSGLGLCGVWLMLHASAPAQLSYAQATSTQTTSSGADQLSILEPVSPGTLESTESTSDAPPQTPDLQGRGQVSPDDTVVPLNTAPFAAPFDAVPSSAVTGYVDASVPLRLPQRGPYYPAALDAALPFPEPIFPELAPDLRLVIRLSERRVYLYDRDEVKTSYPIAVGRAGWETPVGNHEIINMVVDPGWQNPFTGAVIPPGPSNPLGDRWIGFWTDGDNYIGFHGTPNEGSVGRAASHGCIRMYNRDVRELFEKVAVGTPVIVEP